MHRIQPLGGSGALRRIEEVRKKVANLRERFDCSGRIAQRVQALSHLGADIMHTIATAPKFCQDPTMLSGRKFIIETESKTTKKGTPLDESATERYGLTMRAVLKRELEDFADSFDIDLSDVMKSGAQLYTNGFLPVLGKIPAGDVKEAIQSTKYYEVVPPYLKPRPDDFLLEVSGDSMSPKIDTGSLVMLRPDIEPSNGEICAVQVFRKGQNDKPQSTLKRLFHSQEKQAWILKPINPDYPEMVFPYGEYELNVVGVFRGQMAQS